MISKTCDFYLGSAHDKSKLSNIVRNKFSYGYKNKILIKILGKHSKVERIELNKKKKHKLHL